jgi:hypothetical protein
MSDRATLWCIQNIICAAQRPLSCSKRQRCDLKDIIKAHRDEIAINP